MSTTMSTARVHVIISGRVQGVYFRHNTHKKAVELGLTGWVRNRTDGTVEAVFEGPPRMVNEMLQWCRTGPPSANVTHVEEIWEEPTQKYPSFIIRF